MNRLIIAMLLLAPVGGALADAKTDRLLKDVQKVYEKLENVCADFTQTFFWKLTEETQKAKGRICAKGGDKFKIETDEQLIVTDGKTLWTFNKLNNQVVIDHAENSTSDNPFIKDFFKKYLTDYSPFPDEEHAAKDLACVLLKAKTDDQFIRQLRLWIDKKSKMILKIEQVDLNENTTTFELSNIDVNAPLVSKNFIFEPPADAEVIDMR